MAMVNVVESHAVGDVTLTRSLLKIHQAGYNRKLLRCFGTKENCSLGVNSTTACLLQLRFTQDAFDSEWYSFGAGCMFTWVKCYCSFQREVLLYGLTVIRHDNKVAKVLVSDGKVCSPEDFVSENGDQRYGDSC